MKNIPVVVLCSSLLLLLFTYTALSKLSDYDKFVRLLHESPLIHKGADMIGWLLPVTELIVVLLLFFERTRRMGLFISLFLLVLFTVYLLYMVLFVADLPCSCGGVLRKMSWQQHVWFNLFFILVNLLALQPNCVFVFINFLRKQGKLKT